MMENTTPNLQDAPAIDHPISYFNNEFETSVAYNRSDELHVEFVLSRKAQTFTIATFPLLGNPNMEPETQIILSPQEARLLRDLLNRPEIQACLDAE